VTEQEKIRKAYKHIEDSLKDDEGIKRLQRAFQSDQVKHAVYKMNCGLGLVN
jgi:hypothetical protein